MCAPSNGKPLNPKAESWKPEQGTKMEPRLPHQFFPPPPPPPQPPRLFLTTCINNNFYTLPPSENLPSYYYQTTAADGKYAYVDHQFVPLDPHYYGYFSLSNFHNTPISYNYHPLQHPFIPKHPNAVQGMDGASGEGDVEASSPGGKVIPEKNDSKMADYDLVAVKGNARDGGCRYTSRMISMKQKKGFVATVPPRFIRNGRSVKDGWYRTTNAANTRKSSRVFSLKWKPKCGGGGGGGVDQGVKKCVDSSDMASSYRNDDPLSSNNTTVMIKNIPNKLRRHSLINFLDRYCKDHNLEYDFIYLPMDFKRLDNLGYAFVNFTSASDAVMIRELLHNYKWGGCGVVVPTTSSPIPGYGPSKKICQVTWARIQGKDELVKHFELSAFACHTDEYLPAVLDPPRNGLTSFTIPKAIGKLKPPGCLYPRHLLRRKTNQ